jgi:chemotaxis protein MotA
MDKIFLIGLLTAWGCTIGSILLEGGHMGSFAKLAPAVLVIGGTWGAMILGLTTREIKEIGKFFKRAMQGLKVDYEQVIGQVVDYATRSRRDGILSLESDIEGIGDEFMRKGFQLAVDGVDVDHMRTIMETDIATAKNWYKEGQEVFMKLGGFSPTLGIIGTVLGLVEMLSKLEDPGTMGPAIASAFIATLYGVSLANLLYIPIAHKLKRVEGLDVLQKQIVMEGIIGIQTGTSPRMIEQHLVAFLHEKKRTLEQKKKGA